MIFRLVLGRTSTDSNKLLGLYNVPPTIKRKVKVQSGFVQLWAGSRKRSCLLTLSAGLDNTK
jgi:hypothetical protein